MLLLFIFCMVQEFCIEKWLLGWVLQAAYFKQFKIYSLQDRFERRSSTLHATNKVMFSLHDHYTAIKTSKCYVISLLVIAALQASCEIKLSGNHVLMYYEGTTMLRISSNRYNVLITQEDFSL